MIDTWQKPTRKRETARRKKSAESVNRTRARPLSRKEHIRIFLAVMYENIGVAISEPNLLD